MNPLINDVTTSSKLGKTINLGYGWREPQSGLTLRDYFAGQALANRYTYDANPTNIAKWSYKIADEMLKEREVKP